MHLSMCCPTAPHGLKWGFDTKISPHYGAFDISEYCPTIYGAFDNFLSHPRIKSPHRNWGLCGDLTSQICPTMGHLTFWCVKSPLLPRISPRGVVGLYIDRCITNDILIYVITVLKPLFHNHMLGLFKQTLPYDITATFTGLFVKLDKLAHNTHHIPPQGSQQRTTPTSLICQS